MPTNRPRHTLTETDQLRDALAVARQQWPSETSPSQLLLRLVKTGRDALERQNDERRRRHRDAVMRTAGALPGCYEPGERDRMRDEWPE